MKAPAWWKGWRHHDTSTKIELLRAMMRDGMTRADMARELRVTDNAISGLVHRHLRDESQHLRRNPSAEMCDLAKQIKAGVAKGLTVVEAGRDIGLTKGQTQHIAKMFGITGSREAVLRALRQNAQRARAAKMEAAQRQVRNPKLSPAQQAVADSIKNQMWKRVDHRLMALGAPTDDEAARLVADFIAKRGVTQCPPPVTMQAPVNYGVGWGTRKAK